MSFIHTTYPDDAAKGRVSEIGIASTGDEFLDVLTRHLDDASRNAEKAGAVARKADDDHARANERLYAIRAAVEAYREASSQKLARRAEGDR